MLAELILDSPPSRSDRGLLTTRSPEELDPGIVRLRMARLTRTLRGQAGAEFESGDWTGRSLGAARFHLLQARSGNQQSVARGGRSRRKLRDRAAG
jgi:hypothetical protein